jgi:predicted methyltransferase
VLSSIRKALKTGGRFIVIDFQRVPGVSPPRTLEHVRAGKPAVIAEIEANGFRLRDEVSSIELKQNYYLIFEKR